MFTFAYRAAICSLIFIAISNTVEAASIDSDDVVVTANRIPESRENVVADITVISRNDIQRAGQATLTELLRGAPGVEIVSNGGVGQLSSISLRGNSGQSTLVLLDGMRIGSATVGLAALERINIDQIERIEIVRGASSSLYGSDAIGGVIQIFTRQGKGKPHLSASVGYGSHDTREAAAGLSGEDGDTRFAINISNLDTEGISTLRTSGGNENDHDAHRNTSVSATISHQVVPGHELGLQFFNSRNHTEYDDDAFFPAELESTLRSFSVSSHNKFNEIWQSHLTIGESVDDLDSEGSFSGKSKARTEQRQYIWQNDLKLPLGTLVLGYDRVEQRVKGNPGFTTYVRDTRDNNGWVASYLLNHDQHAFQARLRADDNSQFGWHTTGNIGYGYQVNQEWRISGNYGTAFRAPTFNDLYWPFQDFGPWGTFEGNPDLKPETSRNRELSITYDQGHHRLSATIFYNQINDLIVGAQGLFNDFPANVGSATIKGVTVSYEGWLSNFHIRATGTSQSPKNDDTGNTLSRRAHQYGSIWLGQDWGGLEIGSELIASGRRYDDVANTFEMDGYAIVNLTANYKIDSRWSINAQANNIFDKEYTLATLFGTPYGTQDASLFVGIRFDQ